MHRHISRYSMRAVVLLGIPVLLAVWVASTSGIAHAKTTKPPIKIGLITGLTGPFAANLGQVGNLARVWQDAVNSSGGINGSPVKVIVGDDSSDPSKALVVARQ